MGRRAGAGRKHVLDAEGRANLAADMQRRRALTNKRLAAWWGTTVAALNYHIIQARQAVLPTERQAELLARVAERLQLSNRALAAKYGMKHTSLCNYKRREMLGQR